MEQEVVVSTHSIMNMSHGMCLIYNQLSVFKVYLIYLCSIKTKQLFYSKSYRIFEIMFTFVKLKMPDKVWNESNGIIPKIPIVTG